MAKFIAALLTVALIVSLAVWAFTGLVAFAVVGFGLLALAAFGGVIGALGGHA